MNAARRKRISKIYEQLETIADSVNEILIEEEEARDNMPESLKDSEKGAKSQEALDALSTAENSLRDAFSSLDEAMG